MITLALAQLNPSILRTEHNLSLVKETLQKAAAQKVDLVLFPELCLTGYSADDGWLEAQNASSPHALHAQLAPELTHTACILGYLGESSTKNGTLGDTPAQEPRHTNSAALLTREGVAHVVHKEYLPNYGVFDERRYFQSQSSTRTATFKGIRLGIVICEDFWHDAPIQQCLQDEAELLLILNASPVHLSKHEERLAQARHHVLTHRRPLLYVNLWGGQDDLLFDGQSFAMNAAGEVISSAPAFEDAFTRYAFDPHTRQLSALEPPTPVLEPMALLERALVTSLRDYCRKNRVKDVFLGLSGGIDSAVVAVLATEALGAEHVQAVLMPSRFTADMSVEDATELAEHLGITHHTCSIEPAYEPLLRQLSPYWEGRDTRLTEQNLQARIRGQILMAFANTYGGMVLTTSNKSELAVGYTTLYGDMAGGFSILKDVKKTVVYELARWINREKERIPSRILERPPSAELAPDQTDQDTLPPYAVLDRLIECYVEGTCTLQDCENEGIAAEVAAHVRTLMRRAEHKRWQSPPGPRVTTRSLGRRDWRWPLG